MGEIKADLYHPAIRTRKLSHRDVIELKFGSARPPHQAKEVNFEKESIASEWEKIIREDGAAFIAGKLNPYWFDDSEKPKPIRDPNILSFGQVNMPGNSANDSLSPNAENSGKLIAAARRGERAGVQNNQYLLLSKRIDPQIHKDEDTEKEKRIRWVSTFESSKLPEKFSQKSWRQLTWVMWADQRQANIGNAPVVSYRTLDFDEVQFNVFLEDRAAATIFTEMQNHPEELPKLLELLYPKLMKGDFALKMVDSQQMKIFKDIEPIGADYSEILKNAPVIPLK